MMNMLLCTDDTLISIPESLICKAAIKKGFECRVHHLLPTDFKAVDVIQDNENIVLRQMEYLNTKGKTTIKSTRITKPELNRDLTDDEITAHRTATGRLAWITTGTFPTSACIASIVIQGEKRHLRFCKVPSTNISRF